VRSPIRQPMRKTAGCWHRFAPPKGRLVSCGLDISQSTLPGRKNKRLLLVAKRQTSWSAA
jgi:hypothetical protein